MSKEENINAFNTLTSKLGGLRVTAQQNNEKVGEMMVSSDTVAIHNLIKERKCIYGVDESPPGKWSWEGLREIKKKAGPDNDKFTLPDGISTFYGNFNYNYLLSDETGKSKVICHDVVSMAPIILDAKPRPPPKQSGSGVYGVDWWNVYVPLELIQKITRDIKSTSGYILNSEGIVKDPSQNLASVTINIREESKSPKITMVLIDDGTAEDTILKEGDEPELVHKSMGKLFEIMATGGEEALIGGVGFFSIGVSCKAAAGGEPPPAGTPVKLSMKMKAFHALELFEDGISRITYSSRGEGLSYG